MKDEQLMENGSCEEKCECDEKCPLENLGFKDNEGKEVEFKKVLETMVGNNNALMMKLQEIMLIQNKILQVMEILMPEHSIEFDEQGKIKRGNVIAMPREIIYK